MFSGARQPQHARTAVRLLPREEEFFDLFVEVATRSTLAAQHLRELFDAPPDRRIAQMLRDRKSTRLNSSHDQISYAVFCLKKKKKQYDNDSAPSPNDPSNQNKTHHPPAERKGPNNNTTTTLRTRNQHTNDTA